MTVGNHTIFVNDFWESNNIGYRYGFKNWTDISADNPRNITVVADTTITAFFIKKWCPGDVNGDGVVDMKGIFIIILCFGATREKPEWDSRSDLNRYNVINMQDQFIVILNYGNSY